MDTKLYSVEELEKILGLHPKTIRRFIREGKIKGRKIGRTWKVSADDLRDYAHAELAEPKPTVEETADFSSASSDQRISVSTVVELHEKNAGEASRIANSMMAMLNHKDPDWGPSDFRVAQYPEQGTARFVFTGTPRFIAEVMKMFDFISGEE